MEIAGNWIRLIGDRSQPIYVRDDAGENITLIDNDTEISDLPSPFRVKAGLGGSDPVLDLNGDGSVGLDDLSIALGFGR